MERNFQIKQVKQIDWQEIIKLAKQTRKEQKISQKRLSAIIGISTQTISRFEQGKQDIQLSTALKILRALGLAV